MPVNPPLPIGVPIESPCVRVCEIDRTVGICIGCKRTLDEIAAWGRMSIEERRRVMDDLKIR